MDKNSQEHEDWVREIVRDELAKIYKEKRISGAKASDDSETNDDIDKYGMTKNQRKTQRNTTIVGVIICLLIALYIAWDIIFNNANIIS